MTYKEFRGNDSDAVELLNSICKLIDEYELEGTYLEGVLYVGRKQYRAINTIMLGDPSIDRNVKTGETRLYGMLVVPVLEEDYASVAPSYILQKERR